MIARKETVAPSEGGLRRNILTLYVVQTMNVVLPLITVPYLVRALGPSSYGVLAFAGALIVYFAAFTDFGFGTAGTRAAAAARHDARQLGTLLASVTAIRAGLMCLAVLALAALLATSTKFSEHAAVYVASAITLVGTALFPAWLLQGIEAMRTLAVSTVIGRLIAVVLLLIFVRGPDDVAVAAAVQSLPLLLALLLVAKPLVKNVPLRYWKVDRSQFPTLFADSRNAFMSSGAVTLYTSATTLVLGFFAPAAIVGAFSAAAKMVAAISSVFWAPVSQGVYPRVASLLARNDQAAAERLLARILRILLPVAALITVSLWVLAEPIVRVVLGPEMGAAAPLFRILCGLPALLVLSNFFGVLVLFAHGEFAPVWRLQITVFAASLLWLIPLTQVAHAEGAAWSALVTETIITAGFIYLCRTRGLLRWARMTSS